MFGYVKPCRLELKVKDYEKFKAYYCGLCHSIKNLYGNLPRFALNYDMTFLGILLDGLNNEKINSVPFNCAIHPLKKRILIKDNKALEFSAHMNVILSYYKMLDDVNDDNSIKSKVSYNVFKIYINKYIKELNEIALDICFYLRELSINESSKEIKTLDELSHPFNHLTGLIMSYYYKDNDDIKNHLYNIGYNLGKWIYIIDAYDDLEKDIKYNKFNALTNLYNENNLSFEEFKEYIRPKVEFILLSCGNQCFESCQNLTFYKNKDLIYNILSLGIMEQTHNVLRGVSNNEKSL